MYHDLYLEAPLRGIPKSAAMYHVAKNTFKQHLSAIIDSGIYVITIKEFLEGNFDDSVVLTFDDGWKGAFEIAVPLLREYGLKATFFITKNFVGRSGCCNQDMIVQAAKVGMEFGVHGTTHRMLSSCSREEIIWELKTCKYFLESLLNQPVEGVSLPGGDINSTIVSCITEAGFKSFCTSKPGINKIKASPFNIRRIAIRETTSASDIERYCKYNIRKELIRWNVFQIPRCLIGMKSYSLLRRRILGEKKDAAYNLFKP